MTEHRWQSDKNGEPDCEAFTVVMPETEHSGPRCTVCGFTFCIHCFRAGWSHECPGPPPEGKMWCWIGDGNGHPPATPDVW